MGEEFCLGGNRGGRPGAFGLFPGTAGGSLVFAPSLRPGGGGRCDVDRPVVSARYGTEGGFLFLSSSWYASSSSLLLDPSISSRVNGAPRPSLRSPPALTCRGGGPKADGSFKVCRGRVECSSEFDPLLFPIWALALSLSPRPVIDDDSFALDVLGASPLPIFALALSRIPSPVIDDMAN